MAEEIKVSELYEAAGGVGKYIRYVVKKGDTLSEIACRYNVYLASLVLINNIENPDLIRVGQVLIIPVE